MKKLLVFMISPCFAMEIPQDNLFVRNTVGQAVVSYKDQSFFVNNQELQKSDLDETLRKVRNTDHLKVLLAHNYIAVNKSDNGEFSLKNEQRLDGSGPLLGGVAWFTVKIAGALPMAIAKAVCKKKAKRRAKHGDRHAKALHRAHHVEQITEHFSEGVHIMHGHGPDVAVEAGTSFLVDASGVTHIIDKSGRGDDTYMASLAAMGPQVQVETQGIVDKVAEGAFEFFSKLPGW